jgi:uncharacterized membrane protein (UPF0136 family)
MMRIFKQTMCAGLLIISSLFFITFTSSINAAQPMGGAMSMSPSGWEWGFIVLAFDTIFVLLAISAIKLLKLRRSVVGGLLIIVGVAITILGVHNQINAPRVDEINDGGGMPVHAGLNLAVYGSAAACLIGGGLGILPSLLKKNAFK